MSGISPTGSRPRAAAHKAMDEVTGAVVAIAFGLSAVFVPTAFISGISGQFFKQFALTIATSTMISAFVSLTLTPALCGILLTPHGQAGLVRSACGIGRSVGSSGCSIAVRVGEQYATRRAVQLECPARVCCVDRVSED